MIWAILMISAGVIAGGGLAMTLINFGVYRRADAEARPPTPAPLITICIPARNEQDNIEACVRSLLANDYPEIEVVVYDDDSTDDTPDILRRLSQEDPRVRIAPHAPLPPGWVGKQHACAQAAHASRGQWLLFTDSDVRFEPACLRLALDEALRLRAQLISTFPRELTGTLAEALIVPMIHFVLFSYLPMPRMRENPSPAASAGCGQFLLVRRDAYDAAGGHESWKDSMHDGIRMPRAIRRAGYRSDLFDGTDLCSCRMYEGLGQSWRGFAKNAYEGLGSPVLLLFITALHLIGHVLPWVYLLGIPLGAWDAGGSLPAILAIALAFTQRMLLAQRFGQPILGALLHPVGIVMMTAIQWHSFVLHITGRRSWRGRSQSTSPTAPSATV
ncbi:MAG: glycosyltransferase [Planctomycetota bacterium]